MYLCSPSLLQTLESMVMHSGVKHKHTSQQDVMAPTAFIERQQQTLLDLSIHKLHQEQLKYGIEPRLLRFVLINNALRSLQAHVLSRMDGGEDGMVLFGDQASSDLFLTNTFKHGLLSIPTSPPTPVKMIKLDGGSPFTSSTASAGGSNSHSSLLNNTGVPTLGCMKEGQDQLETMPLIAEESNSESRAVMAGSKRSAGARVRQDGEEEEEAGVTAKRLRPSSLSLSDNLLNGFTSSSSEHFSDDSNPLSPIDFAKVDVSLYDFDARTTLSFPPVAETPRSPSSLSCSLHAYTGVTDDPATSQSCSSSSSSPTVSSVASSTATSASQSPSHLSLPSESSEADPLDDIDRIVSLLMA